MHLPEGCDYKQAIDIICKASHPAWVDIAQRRRWLEALASSQRTSAQKLSEVLAAAGSVGIGYEQHHPQP